MHIGVRCILSLLCRLVPPSFARQSGSQMRLATTTSKFHRVVMLRHGESVWNVENRFTGWCDVPLTAQGEADAIDAGNLIGERGLKFDVAFTSNLERAWRTCAMVLAHSGQSNVETIRSSFLNERHYGALQGLHKDDPKLLAEYGESTVMDWRRSYEVAPPSMYDVDFAQRMGCEDVLKGTTVMSDKYIDPARLDATLRSAGSSESVTNSIFRANALLDRRRSSAPCTESLKQCEARVFGYWKEVIAPRVLAGERVLIVAHANTLRALVKAIDQIEDEKIPLLKIPNGIPLVYTLNDKLEPIDIPDTSNVIGFNGAFLVSARNHGKMMTYEKCVRKKLRSLFEYLDLDGNGTVTEEELLKGLARLHQHQHRLGPRGIAGTTATGRTESSGGAGSSTSSVGAGSGQDIFTEINESQFEYDVEELLRCVPSAAADGGITLRSFLEAEETLLPKLTSLKLLQ